MVRANITESNTNIDKIVHSEWTDCLKKIRDDDRKLNTVTSSAVTGHMSTMISNISNRIQRANVRTAEVSSDVAALTAEVIDLTT